MLRQRPDKRLPQGVARLSIDSTARAHAGDIDPMSRTGHRGAPRPLKPFASFASEILVVAQADVTLPAAFFGGRYPERFHRRSKAAPRQVLTESGLSDRGENRRHLLPLHVSFECRFDVIRNRDGGTLHCPSVSPTGEVGDIESLSSRAASPKYTRGSHLAVF